MKINNKYGVIRKYDVWGLTRDKHLRFHVEKKVTVYTS